MGLIINFFEHLIIGLCLNIRLMNSILVENLTVQYFQMFFFIIIRYSSTIGVFMLLEICSCHVNGCGSAQCVAQLF